MEEKLFFRIRTRMILKQEGKGFFEVEEVICFARAYGLPWETLQRQLRLRGEAWLG